MERLDDRAAARLDRGGQGRRYGTDLGSGHSKIWGVGEHHEQGAQILGKSWNTAPGGARKLDACASRGSVFGGLVAGRLAGCAGDRRGEAGPQIAGGRIDHAVDAEARWKARRPTVFDVSISATTRRNRRNNRRRG